MRNLVMADRLKTGVAIDVHAVGEMYQGPNKLLFGTWRLHGFMDDHEYVDAEDETWIQSIGRNAKTGEFYAAFDNRFYQHPNPDWECVFLR